MQVFFHWMLRNGSYFLLFSVIIALIRRRYLIDCLRYVGWFVGLAALGEIVSLITAELNIRNLHILHVYTILEFNLIALFYRSFFGQFYPRWLVPVLMVGFTGFAILNSLLLQPLNRYNTYARGLEALLVMAMALFCFYKILTELSAKRLDKNPVFWINTGFLLYFAGSLFFLILSNAVITDSNRALTLMIFGLHSFLMVLMHIFIGVGLWFSPRLR
ncbi:hypothetical protein [Spirosoma foliorum]|uniref:Uncharacterized protein n=1 Tax=Spirosoma foliorum TaxID=2710596 RepID=A0A7G5GXV9_9BACT|nr:hypothetical protein [Spirosoma foliorum]QMW03701.1 hypothetical protein H3H32_01725 [Spirosoma foliorum]